MKSYHACVWIDHQEAKIFGIRADDAEKTILSDQRPPHHIHRKANHLDLGTAPMDRAFLAEVAAGLKRAKAILIAGPGRARTELAGYLQEEHPAIARRVWGVQAMDHPTDGELTAAARKYFNAADRMHQ